jgi:hypothetical protein
MPANKNWARWIHASVGDYFTTHFANESVPLFIEGQHRDTNEIQHYAELRINGPRLYEVSKDCWLFRVEVNVLLTSSMNDSNYLVIQQNVGIAQAGFVNINTYRYGTGPEDDDSFLGCLRLIQNRTSRDFLEAHQFGQIDIKTHLLQATVEGHYKMLINI